MNKKELKYNKSALISLLSSLAFGAIGTALVIDFFWGREIRSWMRPICPHCEPDRIEECKNHRKK